MTDIADGAAARQGTDQAALQKQIDAIRAEQGILTSQQAEYERAHRALLKYATLIAKEADQTDKHVNALSDAYSRHLVGLHGMKP